MRTVLVCGGRAYPDKLRVWHVLDALHAADPITTLVTGDARWRDPRDPRNRKLWRGADWFATTWAVDRGVWLEIYEADWNAHGRAAGPIRNQRMLDEQKPSLAVAFPGARGTADMVSRARRAGIEVMEVIP